MRYRRSFGLSNLIVLVIAAIVILYLSWPSKQDFQTSRDLVVQAYESARSGSLENIPLERWKWEEAQQKYGQVLDYHIVDQHYVLRGKGEIDVDVNVTRERAKTREIVSTIARRSSVYGYYATVSDFTVESAQPNVP